MCTINIKLRDFLQQHGLSAYRLAKRVEGVSPKTVYAVNAGRSRPSLDALGRIVEALRDMTGEDIKPGDLLEFVPTARPQRDSETRAWLDASLESMALGVQAAEATVPPEELREWLQAMQAAVKPLDA